MRSLFEDIISLDKFIYAFFFSINVFKKASVCRHFENEVFKRIKSDKIKFPVYLSAGQEYVPASIAQIIKEKK